MNANERESEENISVNPRIFAVNNGGQESAACPERLRLGVLSK
jgi:hypothetical protein